MAWTVINMQVKTVQQDECVIWLFAFGTDNIVMQWILQWLSIVHWSKLNSRKKILKRRAGLIAMGSYNAEGCINNV